MTVAELAVKIKADLSDFNSGMESLQGKLAPVGEKFKAFGSAASTYVTLPLAAAGVGMIKLASDAEEMQTKFDVVFANTGSGVTAALSEFGDAVGRSVFELKGMASQLGDTLKPLGFTEEAAAGLSVDLVKLATDLSSFNNMPMDEALRRLQGTLVGSHENALAFGVVINENTLKAQMLEDGTADLTGAQYEQAKVQARINLLMQGTTDAQGDAARTADGFANKLRGLQASLRDVAIQFGEKVLPLATRVVEKFTSLIDWVSSLSERNQKLVLTLGAVAAAIGPLSVAIGFLMTTLNPWAVLIGAVITAGVALVANWDSIKAWVDTNFPLISAGIGIAVDVIVKLFENIWTTAKHTWDQVVNYISTAVEVISGIAVVFFDVFTGDWSGAWDGVKQIFSSIWEGIVRAFDLAIQAIKDVMPGFVREWLGWTDEVSADTGKIEAALAATSTQADKTAKSFGSGSNLSQSLAAVTSQMNSAVVPAVQTVTEELEKVEAPAARAAEGLEKMNARGLETPNALNPAAVSLRTLGTDADNTADSIDNAEQSAESFSTSMATFGSGFMQSMTAFETLFGNIGGTFGKLLDTSQILINSTFPAIKSLIGGMDKALGAFGVSLSGVASVAGPLGILAWGFGQTFGSGRSGLSWAEQGVTGEQAGTAIDLGLLLQGGINASGLDFNSGWLTGQGTVGGVAGSGAGGRISIYLDSREIATAVVPHMAGDLSLYGTNG